MLGTAIAIALLLGCSENEARKEEKAQQREAELRELQERHIRELRRILVGPRTVVGVRGKYVMLEGGFGLRLHRVYGPNWEERAEDVRSQLMGKTIQVFLPRDEEFKRSYVPAAYNGWRKKYGLARDSKGLVFGEVPALVYINGKLFNLRWTRRDALAHYPAEIFEPAEQKR